MTLIVNIVLRKVLDFLGPLERKQRTGIIT